MTDPISHHGPVRYEPVAVSAETTVAAEFVPGSASDTAYQLEAASRSALLGQLQEQGYAYLPITTEGQLVANPRDQLRTSSPLGWDTRPWTTCWWNPERGSQRVGTRATNGIRPAGGENERTWKAAVAQTPRRSSCPPHAAWASRATSASAPPRSAVTPPIPTTW